MTEYLVTKVMRATASCMSLASYILGFDIIELWHEESNGSLKCTYVHCTPLIKKLYPDIISGHYPEHKKEHKHSPQLCKLAKASSNRVHWEVLNVNGDQEATNFEEPVSPSLWHALVAAPIQTEMAYHLEAPTGGINVYVVGFSLKKTVFMDSKIRFLSGLGYAIYVAAFDLDESDVVLPEELNEFVHIHGIRRPSLDHLDQQQAPQRGQLEPVVSARDTSVPWWEPVDSYSFPIRDIPVAIEVPNDMKLEDFENVKHIADGSNSNIYLGKLDGEKVIIKMIKEEVQTDEVALHEFDVEHGILCRLNHKYIIKILGAGSYPRRFLVLEYLGGGSLNQKLTQNQNNKGLAQKLFKKPLFSYPVLLATSLYMAEALDYLHSKICPGALIIHRDLKPDNVGFTADGTLKLFDFGLCSVVRTRTSADDLYELTGNTGSLRYMAPEVYKEQPYSEKVDVYSYAIMVWQMARDKLPFKGFTRDEFATNVVKKHERPKLDKAWPQGFNDLLTACWHKDPESRPSFADVVVTLNKLLREAGSK